MTIDQLPTTMLISSTVATGLSAGLLYGFACAVMPGLKDVDDRAFVAVMQSVNRRILNGWFLATFVGAPLLTAGAAVTAFLNDSSDQRIAIGGAALLSLLSIAITGSVNVPLNNALGAAGSEASVTNNAPAMNTATAINNATVLRGRFERRWTRGNIARAAASTAAFGGLVWALANGG
jgi:uncharacterized membrane protein